MLAQVLRPSPLPLQGGELKLWNDVSWCRCDIPSFPGLNTSVGSLELLCGVSLTCRFECPCDTVHRWVYPWVLKTQRSHGFSNFQCMEAELLPVPIPSPARWPWMLFEPYNQGWNTRNRHKMSLGLGKYWACTLCMNFRKKVLSILSSTWFLRGFSYFNPDMSVWL